MKVKELRDILNNMPERYDENEVSVKVFRRNSMGGTPAVKIKSIINGFDWDSGRCIIGTEVPVMEISKEEQRDINIDTIIN